MAGVAPYIDLFSMHRPRGKKPIGNLIVLDSGFRKIPVVNQGTVLNCNNREPHTLCYTVSPQSGSRPAVYKLHYHLSLTRTIKSIFKTWYKSIGVTGSIRVHLAAAVRCVGQTGRVLVEQAHVVGVADKLGEGAHVAAGIHASKGCDRI